MRVSNVGFAPDSGRLVVGCETAGGQLEVAVYDLADPAKAPAPAVCPKRHHRRKTAGKDLQKIGQKGSGRGGSQRRRLAKMQRDDDCRKDQGLSGHALSWYRVSI